MSDEIKYATPAQSCVGFLALFLILGISWWALREPSRPAPPPVQAGPVTRAVSRKDLGKDWPFTCESGMLRRTPLEVKDGPTLQAISFQPAGSSTWYGLNGHAISHGDQDIERAGVWAKDDTPNIPEEFRGKKSIGPLITLGLSL